MQTLKTSSFLLASWSLLASTASAQAITPLVVEGDVLPHGTVTATYNVDVNSAGDWLVELDTDNVLTTMDNAIVYNGTVIHQEGTSMGFPASHVGAWVYDGYVDSMDVNNNGDRMLIFNVEDVSGAVPDAKLVLWTNGSTDVTYPLLEEDVTACTVAGEPAGALWDNIIEVWQNDNNEIILAGRSTTDSDTILAVITHDGAGTILSQTMFAVENVIHNVAFPAATGIHADTVQGFTTSKANIAFNNAGQKMFYIDDESFGSGGSPDYTAVDSHYYIDDTEIAWEADDAPTAGIWPFNHLSSAEVDINDSGDWVAAWDDDNPATTDDGFILVNGAIFAQEGQPAPIGGGFVLEGVTFNNGSVQISSAGDITWTAEWNDPDTSKDKGLYRNMDLLVQEGVTMVSGLPVIDIRSSSDTMAVSDSGRFIIKEMYLEGSIEGVFMIEVEVGTAYCFGDGNGTACPCGNQGADGEGCTNSTSVGAILEASGSSSISGDDLVLLGSQLPANKPGLFFQGPNQVASGNLFGDGLLCVGGAIQRMQTIFSDGGGNSTTSVPIASTYGASVGSTVYFQLWYRDPAGPCGTQFNTSNALVLTWE